MSTAVNASSTASLATTGDGSSDDAPFDTPVVGTTHPWGGLALAAAAIGLVVWALVIIGGHGDVGPDVVRAILVVAWAVAAALLAVRRPGEPMGRLIGMGALAGALAEIGEAALLAHQRGMALSTTGVSVAHLARALGLALIPAAVLFVVLAVPDGSLDRWSRRAGWTALAVGAGLGVALWAARPAPLWPVVVEGTVALFVAAVRSRRRYQHSAGVTRQRMQWFGWAVTVTVEVALVAAALRILVGWPPHAFAVIALTQLPIPIALVAASSPRLTAHVDRLLASTVSLTGLSGIVIAVYMVIVIGLGRVPTHAERTLLLLSMIAASLAALLFVPTRERLGQFANRLVYGQRRPPDDVLRTFGARLTRAIPLDELLLQVVESLRSTLALSAAEVWTVAGGALERSVSSPDAPPDRLTLTADEEVVVARAGVSGPAWIHVWLSPLEAFHRGSMLRVAPIAHSGELLGLIVVARPGSGDAFRDEDEQALTELARQMALALHNVRLDSALQESLDEVRRQSEEIQASRSRIVAAADSERRRIERNLHDGAQQQLVALAVGIRLARVAAERDPASTDGVLEQLAEDLQEAIQELRRLAHGIYPPLLMDRGLAEALSAAAGRASIPTSVDATDVGRYPPETEATVYFCCLEALQNAGKHAGDGASARVRVWEEQGGLLFEVADDGAGFDPKGRPGGAGFVNMADRLGAVGGRLRVTSAPGEGTMISGTIPLAGGTGTARPAL
jgi:signal transduction histidine kinase